MHGGRSALILSSLTFWAIAGWPSFAWGHRLNAEAQAKKIQKVKIESWFDLGGVPSGARDGQFQHREIRVVREVRHGELLVLRQRDP